MRAVLDRLKLSRAPLAACIMAVGMLSACGGGYVDSTTTPGITGTSGGTTPSTDPGASPVTPPPSTATPSTATGSITLSWAAPSTNADGSPVTDLAGYRVYYGNASGYYTDNITISSPNTLTTTIPNLPANTYFVIVRAFNSLNMESQASMEVSKTIS